MFRLPGIFRTVALYSTPKVAIRDLKVVPDLDGDYTNGSLNITADVRNFGTKKAKDYSISYSLYANELYSDQNDLVEGVGVNSSLLTVDKKDQVEVASRLNITNPNKWSSEAPF